MTIIPNSCRAAVLSHATRDYQKRLLTGYQEWSGADLSGKARRYGARYQQSRMSLVRRLKAAGWIVERLRGIRGYVYVEITPGPTILPAVERKGGAR